MRIKLHVEKSAHENAACMSVEPDMGPLFWLPDKRAACYELAKAARRKREARQPAV